MAGTSNRALRETKAGPNHRAGPYDDGRGEKIRTSDPLHPMQVRYQAALRPDRATIIPFALRLEREQATYFLQFPT